MTKNLVLQLWKDEAMLVLPPFIHRQLTPPALASTQQDSAQGRWLQQTDTHPDTLA